MFRKILIANRGESAIRIIKACRELGIRCATMHPEGERGSLAASHSDEDYLLVRRGPFSPYLDMEQIVSIARIAEADAIHPGYGFLSENEAFARMCNEGGIVFIGPSPSVLKKCGNKMEAKKIASGLGVPVIPGYAKPVLSVEQVMAIGSEIGFPLVLKAAEGGGGRGIREVHGPAEAEMAFQSVRREASAAFGSSDVYIEKLIPEPRHIEIQVVADRSGKTVHLGERECSIQRRHQKLIEEAPSTALDDELRGQMGQAAITIARDLGYEGLGSFEFLLEGRKFYFMEINPRLQVEHGITERISGVDLVKEQIIIAYGHSLPFGQDDVRLGGWAIECRINAESVMENFRPSLGIITKYVQPIVSGVSISSGVKELSDVSSDYDSMIAKVIAYGRQRKDAIDKALDALGAFVIRGIDTTIDLEREILRDPEFVRGELSTSFIGRRMIVERMRRRRNSLIIAAAASHFLRNRVALEPNGKEEDEWTKAARLEAMNMEAEQW